ncbi:MAG TPA: hypothetical protein VK978_01190 [Candidatus Saccharimonadales bacterium]|nr:hypothetical protein [Candidatus Saccharimonadales bacterium]
MAAALSPRSDADNQAKDAFMNGYNQARDSYGNRLEQAKNTFTASYGN